jgi:hypothetical protein
MNPSLSEEQTVQATWSDPVQDDGMHPSQSGKQIEQDQEEAEGKDFLDLQHPVLEHFDLGEDVYSLIFIAPICSRSFLFALYTILLKYALYTFLAIDLYEQSGGKFYEKSSLVRATQFFLLPLSVALQEDLIHVYARVANVRYDPVILKKSPAATEWKFVLSFTLRFFDGLYSMIINFVLLLITDEVLSLFLNFAALGFLQSVDDIAFSLAHDGYLGDLMEDNCILVKTATLPRRVGNAFTNSLDSILFATTYGVMLAIYIFIVVDDNF